MVCLLRYAWCMIIRPETVNDYAAIAEVNGRAFGQAREAVIVALHRQRSAFDPELSLVAEVDGAVVGHALFSPRRIRLMEADVKAVSLGPIAVSPTYQGQGVGGALIAEGHRVAASTGCLVSYLVGHPTYYPRFGYRTDAYGSATVTVPVAELPDVGLTERPPTWEDIPALHALWRADEGRVDFAIDPGTALTDWISPNPAIRSLVCRAGQQIVGYVRQHKDRPAEPVCFLAREPEAARAVAGVLARQTAAVALTLPIHPRSLSSTAFQRAMVEPFAAAMATELAPGPLGEYFTQIEAGTRPHGRVIWPVEFDLEGSNA
jgi:putative acetyltransferase